MRNLGTFTLSQCYVGLSARIGSGYKVEVTCPQCGRTDGYLDGIHFPEGKTVIFDQSTTDCPRCMGKAAIKNGTAKLVNGEFSFERKIYELLEPANLTRQQVRRFEHKAKKAKKLEDLERSAIHINPAFSKALDEAQKEPSLRSAIRKVVKVAKFIIGLAGAAITIEAVYENFVNNDWFNKNDTILEAPEAANGGQTTNDGNSSRQSDEESNSNNGNNGSNGAPREERPSPKDPWDNGNDV